MKLWDRLLCHWFGHVDGEWTYMATGRQRQCPRCGKMEKMTYSELEQAVADWIVKLTNGKGQQMIEYVRKLAGKSQ